MYQLNAPARSALSEINELTERLKSGALDAAEMDRLHEELRSAVHRFRAGTRRTKAERSAPTRPKREPDTA